MEIKVHKTETVSISREEQLRIARELIMDKFNLQRGYYLRKEDNMICENEDYYHGSGHYTHKIREATDRDKLGFAILKELWERN